MWLVKRTHQFTKDLQSQWHCDENHQPLDKARTKINAILWIPRYVGINGNKPVDELTKSAVRSVDFNKLDLITYYNKLAINQLKSIN